MRVESHGPTDKIHGATHIFCTHKERSDETCEDVTTSRSRQFWASDLIDEYLTFRTCDHGLVALEDDDHFAIMCDLMRNFLPLISTQRSLQIKTAMT